jgi:hypothetical protein
LDAVQSTGLEAVQADLADLCVDAAGRLLAAGVPIDVVLLRWSGNRIRGSRPFAWRPWTTVSRTRGDARSGHNEAFIHR